MKRFLKRFTALLAAGCVLFSGAALADEWGLSHTLDAWLETGGDVRFSLTGRLDALLPYGQSTLDALNAALSGLSVSAGVTDTETRLDFCVAGDSVVSLAQVQDDAGTALTTPLLPNRTLISAGSAMDALSGRETETPPFDLFSAIDEVQGCYQALTDAIKPYAVEKKANYKIKDVGSSRWSRIARLTPEQGAELAPLIAQVLGCGMDEAFRESLRGMTYSKGFIVGLYQTAEGGEDIAVYIKGNVTFPDGGKRSLSYQWAFATDDDGTRRDTYKFEMKKSRSPRDDREITASYERAAADGRLLLKGESSARIVNPDQGTTTVTALTHDLSGAEGDGVRTVEGSVKRVVKTTVDGETKTVTYTLTPSLQLTASEGSGVLSGTAALSRQSGKQTEWSATFVFDDEPARAFADAANSGTLFAVGETLMPPSSLTQNQFSQDEPDDYLVGKPPVGYTSHTAPTTEQTVDLDALDEAGYAALMDELSQNLAGKLLAAMAKLPEEATALLRDNLSEADYAAFLERLSDI